VNQALLWNLIRIVLGRTQLFYVKGILLPPARELVSDEISSGYDCGFDLLIDHPSIRFSQASSKVIPSMCCKISIRVGG
jgi:hypothetical protein